jgi:hypothetical protein
MRLVIDANVFEGFFKESILQISNDHLTDTPLQLFKRLGIEDVTYFDNNGYIRTEWRNLVEPEWFDVWFPDFLIAGCAYEIPVESCYKLRNQLKQLGFPDKRDFWYIKTAKAIKNTNKVVIVTEDLDFYDPKMKKCNNKTRLVILNNCGGPVAKYLRKNESIEINSLSTYNNSTGC